MPEDVYVLTCGCELSKAETEPPWGCGARICPHHAHGAVSHVVRACIECGTLFEVSPKALRKIRCTACQTARNTARSNESKARIKGYTPDKTQAASQGTWNCVHRDECLSRHIAAGLHGALRCLGCERYEPWG